MSPEFREIADLKAGDEVLAVEFKCGARRPAEITAAPTCGREIVTVGIEENLLPDKSRIKGEERQRRAATPADLKQLYVLLTENLKHPSTETLWMLRTVLDGRNLKIRFQVKNQE